MQFSDYYSDNRKYLNYGDVIMLIQDQNDLCLKYNDQADDIENHFIKHILQSISAQQKEDYDLTDGSPDNLQRAKNLNHKESLYFEHNEDNLFKNSNGLWRIES